MASFFFLSSRFASLAPLSRSHPPKGAVHTALGCRRVCGPRYLDSGAARPGGPPSPNADPREPSEPQRSHLRDSCIEAEAEERTRRTRIVNKQHPPGPGRPRETQ